MRFSTSASPPEEAIVDAVFALWIVEPVKGSIGYFEPVGYYGPLKKIYLGPMLHMALPADSGVTSWKGGSRS